MDKKLKQLIKRVATELPVRRPELFQPIRLFRELDGKPVLSKKKYAVLFEWIEELGRSDSGRVQGYLLLIDQKGQIYLAYIRGLWSLSWDDPNWKEVSTIRRLNPENPQLPEEVALWVKDALRNVLGNEGG